MERRLSLLATLQERVYSRLHMAKGILQQCCDVLLQEQRVRHVGICDCGGIPQRCSDLIGFHQVDQSAEQHSLELEACYDDGVRWLQGN